MTAQAGAPGDWIVGAQTAQPEKKYRTMSKKVLQSVLAAPIDCLSVALNPVS
jgi:hypothetical protein